MQVVEALTLVKRISIASSTSLISWNETGTCVLGTRRRLLVIVLFISTVLRVIITSTVRIVDKAFLLKEIAAPCFVSLRYIIQLIVVVVALESIVLDVYLVAQRTIALIDRVLDHHVY